MRETLSRPAPREEPEPGRGGCTASAEVSFRQVSQKSAREVERHGLVYGIAGQSGLCRAHIRLPLLLQHSGEARGGREVLQGRQVGWPAEAKTRTPASPSTKTLAPRPGRWAAQNRPSLTPREGEQEVVHQKSCESAHQTSCSRSHCSLRRTHISTPKPVVHEPLSSTPRAKTIFRSSCGPIRPREE